jgi:hypothetical protein
VTRYACSEDEARRRADIWGRAGTSFGAEEDDVEGELPSEDIVRIIDDWLGKQLEESRVGERMKV